MYFANITRCWGIASREMTTLVQFFLCMLLADVGVNVFLECPAIPVMSNQQSETLQWLLGTC
jgi:hypothetical protein